MPTNQLMPFANGDTANVIDFTTWNTLPQRVSGFGSGIARSDWFNRILAQGGTAGYVLGQFVVDYTDEDATINATALYQAVKQAIATFIPSAIADKSIASAKIADKAITSAKLADGAVTGAKIAGSTISTDKLSQRASKQDIQNGTSMRVVCSDVVKQYFDVVCPPGMFGFFHATDVPEGWLLCNGATVSRTTYSRLFAKIGTKYGAGDGSTTFALPNLDGRVLQGTTNTGNVGNYLEASLPNIIGQMALYSKVSGSASGAFTLLGSPAKAGDVYETSEQQVGYDGFDFKSANGNSLYNGTTVQSPALQVLPCIRV